MRNMRVSTLITIVLLLVAFGFAFLGFAQAGNLNVSVGFVTFYMMISAAMFAANAVLSFQRPELAHRLVAMFSVTAAIVMVILSIVFFNILRPITVPEFDTLP